MISAEYRNPLYDGMSVAINKALPTARSTHRSSQPLDGLTKLRTPLAYYAVPGNTDAVAAFRSQTTRHWYKALRRHSQCARIN